MLFSPRFFVRSDEWFLTTKKNKCVEIVENRWLSFISLLNRSIMCSSEKERKKGTDMVEKYDDAFLEEKWREFGDVPINYDDPDSPDGVLECDWFVFRAGDERIEDVWRWFDEHYSGGVHKLMFPGVESDRQLLVNAVMNEVTEFCESCSSVNCCPEEECVLFRIESLLVE